MRSWRASTPRTKVVFLANPNNPTGTYLPHDEVRRLHKGLPSRLLLVLDAAYCEYVRRNDYEAGLELVATTDNTVMTRTFSKIYGLAALRLGWAYCPAAVADVLNRVRGPFNVTAPAIAAGVAALADRAHVETAVAHNDKWLPWVTAEIEKLGLKVTPSVGNFVLIHFPTQKGKDAAAADEFLKSRGIILRRVAAYGLPNCLRMTIGTEDDNRKVVAALGELPGAVMTTPMFERVALIGLGLIGSSLSHAMRRGGLARTIVGHAQSEKTRDTALRLGLVGSVYATRGGGRARRRSRHPVRAGRRVRRHRRARSRPPCKPAPSSPTSARSRARSCATSARTCRKGVHFIPGPSDRRHRAFGARVRLRRAVRRPLVRPDAAGGRRHGRGRQARRVLAGAAARTSRSWTPSTTTWCSPSPATCRTSSPTTSSTPRGTWSA